MTRDDLIAALTLHACQCPQDADEVKYLIWCIRTNSKHNIEGGTSTVRRIEANLAARIAKSVNPAWLDGSIWRAAYVEAGAWASSPFKMSGTSTRDLMLNWTLD